MGAEQLKKLKKEIEEYRKRLEKELETEKGSHSIESIIKLSQDLDKLIVKYEQVLKNTKLNLQKVHS